LVALSWRSRPCRSARLHTVRVGYDDDPAGYEQRLKAKLTPRHIRSTMEFAALYQMINEAIRHAVVDEVRQFFTNGYSDGKWS
jgi:hypothetical protein